jgi:hypothetical protein
MLIATGCYKSHILCHVYYARAHNGVIIELFALSDSSFVHGEVLFSKFAKISLPMPFGIEIKD